MAPTADPGTCVPQWSLRPAEERDDPALRALARACPMEGEVTICVRREPRFLALDRLLGEPWQVLVAESNDRVIGCVAWAVREAYVNGSPRLTAYVGDLKVHPSARRAGVGAALALAARDALRHVDPELPVLLTALSGNWPVQALAHESRRGALAVPFATVRVHAIPLIARRSTPPVPDFDVRTARWSEVEELTAFWASVAPTRQFAVRCDPARFAVMLQRAAGLDVSSYLVARGRDGRIAASLAVWDQRPLKSTTIVRYGRAAGALRLGVNLAAPLIGLPRLPAPGGVLRSLQAFNVWAASPEALRALVITALRRYAGGEHTFLMVGLDSRDPLTAALRGLWAQPADVAALVAVPGRLGGCPSLDARPLHYETALV